MYTLICITCLHSYILGNEVLLDFLFSYNLFTEKQVFKCINSLLIFQHNSCISETEQKQLCAEQKEYTLTIEIYHINIMYTNIIKTT